MKKRKNFERGLKIKQASLIPLPVAGILFLSACGGGGGGGGAGSDSTSVSSTSSYSSPGSSYSPSLVADTSKKSLFTATLIDQGSLRTGGRYGIYDSNGGTYGEISDGDDGSVDGKLHISQEINEGITLILRQIGAATNQTTGEIDASMNSVVLEDGTSVINSATTMIESRFSSDPSSGIGAAKEAIASALGLSAEDINSTVQNDATRTAIFKLTMLQRLLPDNGASQVSATQLLAEQLSQTTGSIFEDANLLNTYQAFGANDARIAAVEGLFSHLDENPINESSEEGLKKIGEYYGQVLDSTTSDTALAVISTTPASSLNLEGKDVSDYASATDFSAKSEYYSSLLGKFRDLGFYDEQDQRALIAESISKGRDFGAADIERITGIAVAINSESNEAVNQISSYGELIRTTGSLSNSIDLTLKGNQINAFIPGDTFSFLIESKYVSEGVLDFSSSIDGIRLFASGELNGVSINNYELQSGDSLTEFRGSLEVKGIIPDDLIANQALEGESSVQLSIEIKVTGYNEASDKLIIDFGAYEAIGTSPNGIVKDRFRTFSGFSSNVASDMTLKFLASRTLDSQVVTAQGTVGVDDFPIWEKANLCFYYSYRYTDRFDNSTMCQRFNDIELESGDLRIKGGLISYEVASGMTIGIQLDGGAIGNISLARDNLWRSYISNPNSRQYAIHLLDEYGNSIRVLDAGTLGSEINYASSSVDTNSYEAGNSLHIDRPIANLGDLAVIGVSSDPSKGKLHFDPSMNEIEYIPYSTSSGEDAFTIVFKTLEGQFYTVSYGLSIDDQNGRVNIKSELGLLSDDIPGDIDGRIDKVTEEAISGDRSIMISKTRDVLNQRSEEIAQLYEALEKELDFIEIELAKENPYLEEISSLDHNLSVSNQLTWSEYLDTLDPVSRANYERFRNPYEGDWNGQRTYICDNDGLLKTQRLHKLINLDIMPYQRPYNEAIDRDLYELFTQSHGELMSQCSDWKRYYKNHPVSYGIRVSNWKKKKELLESIHARQQGLLRDQKERISKQLGLMNSALLDILQLNHELLSIGAGDLNDIYNRFIDVQEGLLGINGADILGNERNLLSQANAELILSYKARSESLSFDNSDEYAWYLDLIKQMKIWADPEEQARFAEAQNAKYEAQARIQKDLIPELYGVSHEYFVSNLLGQKTDEELEQMALEYQGGLASNASTGTGEDSSVIVDDDGFETIEVNREVFEEIAIVFGANASIPAETDQDQLTVHQVFEENGECYSYVNQIRYMDPDLMPSPILLRDYCTDSELSGAKQSFENASDFMIGASRQAAIDIVSLINLVYLGIELNTELRASTIIKNIVLQKNQGHSMQQVIENYMLRQEYIDNNKLLSIQGEYQELGAKVYTVGTIVTGVIGISKTGILLARRYLSSGLAMQHLSRFRISISMPKSTVFFGPSLPKVSVSKVNPDDIPLSNFGKKAKSFEDDIRANVDVNISDDALRALDNYFDDLIESGNLSTSQISKIRAISKTSERLALRRILQTKKMNFADVERLFEVKGVGISSGEIMTIVSKGFDDLSGYRGPFSNKAFGDFASHMKENPEQFIRGIADLKDNGKYLSNIFFNFYTGGTKVPGGPAEAAFSLVHEIYVFRWTSRWDYLDKVIPNPGDLIASYIAKIKETTNKTINFFGAYESAGLNSAARLNKNLIIIDTAEDANRRVLNILRQQSDGSFELTDRITRYTQDSVMNALRSGRANNLSIGFGKLSGKNIILDTALRVNSLSAK